MYGPAPAYREVSADGLLGIFHVGSTAVPDIPGKPELDVLAVYESYEPMRAAAEAIVSGRFELTVDDGECIVLVRWDDDSAVFLKLHVRGDERVRNQLLFREDMLENPDARRRYERAKRTAAERHREQPREYIGAKTDVVKPLLADARETRYTDRLPPFVS
ncbi:MAG: GrpB family protein [Halovenus sp.]